MSPLFPYAVACAGAYENVEPTWTDAERDVHVFLSQVDGAPCLTFEGSQSFEDWMRDFQADAEAVVDHPELGKLHEGFLTDVESVLRPLMDFVGGKPFDLAGHSKGGAECLVAAALMTAKGMPPRRVRAFEPARAGGASFIAVLSTLDVAWTQTRNVHGADIVTEVPSWMLQPPNCTVLVVPDRYDISQKHRIPAVLEALAA